MSVKKDIKVGLDCLNSVCLYEFPQGYGKIYVNTNENLSEYYHYFSIKNGKVLTVSAGGDQILQAVYCGAKVIDAFDINRFALYAAKMKIAAMKALSQKQFLDFYNYVKFRDNLSFKHYQKIRVFLDEEARLFWDTMYLKGDFEACNGFMTTLCSSFDKSSSRYDVGDNFFVTKKLLDDVKITYYHDDIYSLLEHIDDRYYDAIFLSNIYDYLMASGRRNYPKYVLEDLAAHLNRGGKIAAYVPHHNDSCEFEEYTGQEKLDRKIYVYERK